MNSVNKIILGTAAVIILCLGAFAVVVVSDPVKASRNQTEQFNLPDGLKDCSVFQVEAKNGAKMTAMRCPNSTTSVQYYQGDEEQSVVISEGTTIRGANPKVDRMDIPPAMDKGPIKLL